MVECDHVMNKPLLERIIGLLERKPELCTLTFTVGPEKKLVKASKLILMAASSVIEKEFGDRTEDLEIPFPDFEPEAFKLFIKLTTLDTWSVAALKKLDVPRTQLLSLLSICRRFGMDFAVRSLQGLTTEFLQLNHEVTNLAFKTQSGEIDEIQPEPKPLEKETKIVELTSSVTDFITAPIRPKPTNSEFPTGCSTISLTKGFEVVSDPPFVSSDKPWNAHWFQSNSKIALVGLGFLGPLEEDSIYDVIVDIYENGTAKCLGQIKKEIWAEKGKIFHVIFDEPFIIEGADLKNWVNYYIILFSLSGPNTATVDRSKCTESQLKENGITFKFRWLSNQLSEILFKKV